MAIISDLRELNDLQPLQALPPVRELQQLQPIKNIDIGETVLKYIPEIMKEKREDFKTVFEVIDFMEKRNMIKYNKPVIVVPVEEEKPKLKEVAIAVGVIFAIIRIAILLI